tara:strand:+ start:540 stop:986 length:447 start_codon:yes stop_codon:yes gene_type:complete
MSENRDRDSSGLSMSTKPNKTIMLGMHELLFIDDHTTMMMDDRDYEHLMPLKPVMPTGVIIVPIDFIDKIGRAFLLAIRTGKDIPVKVSELELYLLRELCFSKAEYFGKRVGLSLKRKVLNALYTQKDEQENLLEQLLKDIDLGEINE